MIVWLLVLSLLSKNIETEQRKWEGSGVEVTVTSAACRDENAYYFPWLELVVVCRELDAKPGVQRFVFNHEMGHAWMYQHGVPNTERGADEIAVLMSDYEDTIAAAHWFADMAKSSSGSDGSHQSHAERAASLFCLAYGLHKPDETTAVCRMYAGSVVDQWQRIERMARK